MKQSALIPLNTPKSFSFSDAHRYVCLGIPVVMVTVIDVKGSAPREPGARMLVTAGELIGTIGGGHLEWRSMEIARASLTPPEKIVESKHSVRRIEKFLLGPTLGQCCGGAVLVAFELLSTADLLWLDAVKAA